MNIPTKIKDARSWILLEDYLKLFLSPPEISSQDLVSTDSEMEGYFNRSNVKQIANKFKSSKFSESYELIKDSLENYFVAIDRTIFESKRFLYLSNPLNPEVRDDALLDEDLQDLVDGLISPRPIVWENDPLKNWISYDLLSNSYIDFDFKVKGDLGICDFYFKYIPTGTEHKLSFKMKLEQLPKDVISHDDILPFEWPIEFTNYFYLSLRSYWDRMYNLVVENDYYSRALYESIMSNKGGLTISDFYVKSYYKNKVEDNIYWESFEKLDGFSDIETKFKSQYSPNVVMHTLKGTYDFGTINPDFKKGISGWNVVTSNLNIDTYKEMGTVDMETAVVVKDSESGYDPELQLNYEHHRLEQVNVLKAGYWKLQLQLQTNVERRCTMYMGDEYIDFVFPVTASPQIVTLTSNAGAGIRIDNQGPVEYGFVLKEVDDPNLRDQAESKIEFCKVIWLQNLT